jgi:WXG100 family type VII secretion target
MSTSGSFQTEVATMQSAAAHVEEVSTGIQGELSRLLGNLEPVASMWQGAAASSFQALQQRWNDDANQLTQVLAQISEGLIANAKSYTAAEEAAQEQLNKTTGDLG